MLLSRQVDLLTKDVQSTRQLFESKITKQQQEAELVRIKLEKDVKQREDSLNALKSQVATWKSQADSLNKELQSKLEELNKYSNITMLIHKLTSNNADIMSFIKQVDKQ